MSTLKIQVCTGCESREKIAAAVRELCKQYGERLTVEYVECLDHCQYPPVVKVNDRVIVWATRGAICAALEQELNRR